MNPQKQTINGDGGFLGANLRADPATLPAGMLADAENMRFRDGVSRPRKGVVKPTWANGFDYNDWVVTPLGTKIYGVGVFSDPNSTEWTIAAVDGGAVKFRENNMPSPIALPTGVKLLGRCRFVQAFNKVFCLRGKYFQPLRLTNFGRGFEDLIPRWGPQAYEVGDEVAYGPFLTGVSITSAATPEGEIIATAITNDPHGYVTGADVVIRNSSVAQYNGRFNITVLTDRTFTFQPSALGAADSNGQCSTMAYYWKANANTLSTEKPGDTSNKWDRIYDVLPTSDDGAFINNRLVVMTAWTPGADSTGQAAYNSASAYTKTDFLAASDVQDEIHVDPSNEFRINQGSADELVGLEKFGDDALVCLKGKSWGILGGVTGDLSLLRLDMREKEYGCVANRAHVVAGGDLYFLAAQRGVVGLRQTEQGKVQSVDLPLSDDIQPLIAQIDWAQASKARLAYWDNKLYVAAPMRDKPSILVYDFLTQKWTPRDTGSALRVVEFFKTVYNGQERLFFAGEDGWVNMIEEGANGDQVSGAPSSPGLVNEEIYQRWRTRMYATPNNRAGKPMEVGLILSTWDPCYTVTVMFDGVNEQQLLQPDGSFYFTRNRVKYDRPFDAEDWDPSNVHGDHGKAYRQDYSVELPLAGMFLYGGVRLDAMQEVVHPLSIAPQQGRAVQVEVVNVIGRVALKAVDLDGVWRKQRKGVVV